MGLPKSKRLTCREDYQRLYDRGRKFVHPLAVFFVLPLDSGESRIGLTVSRKVGKATIRNRVKRRLREVWRGRFAELPASELVVVARMGLARATISEIEEAVTRFLRWLKPRRT